MDSIWISNDQSGKLDAILKSRWRFILCAIFLRQVFIEILRAHTDLKKQQSETVAKNVRLVIEVENLSCELRELRATYSKTKEGNSTLLKFISINQKLPPVSRP